MAVHIILKTLTGNDIYLKSRYRRSLCIGLFKESAEPYSFDIIWAIFVSILLSYGGCH